MKSIKEIIDNESSACTRVLSKETIYRVIDNTTNEPIAVIAYPNDNLLFYSELIRDDFRKSNLSCRVKIGG